MRARGRPAARPSREREAAALRHRTAVVLALVFAALALAWQATPLGQWLRIEELLARTRAIAQEPYAPLGLLAVFVVGGLASAPLMPIIAVTLAVFGPVPGAPYALLGATLSGAITFGLGRRLGRATVRRLAGRRANALSRRLARRGLATVIVVRLLPFAPYTLVNLVAGASHLRWRDFLLGTMLGLLPGIAIMALFVEQALALLREPNPVAAAALVVMLAIVAGVVLVQRRRLLARVAPRRDTPSSRPE